MTPSQTLAWSRVCLSLLGACAPTSVSLKLSQQSYNEYGSFTTSNLGPIPYFRSLRHLDIESMYFGDHPLLRGLLHNDLSSLKVSISSHDVTLDFFRNRAQIQGLESLTWVECDFEESRSMALLNQYAHLHELIFWEALPTEAESIILPVLIDSSKSLRSLSIKSIETENSIRVIETIPQITTLEKLHIGSAFEREGWIVDHHVACRHLSALPSLRARFFTSDIYFDGERSGYSSEVSQYDKYFDRRRRPFEKDHRNRVSEDCNIYNKAMPQLKCLYLGQYPMAIQWNTQSGGCVWRRLTSRRTQSGRVLQSLFGRDAFTPAQWRP